MLCAALVLVGLTLPAKAADAKPEAVVKNIDIVICLDTSNSMDGLIGSAKAKLWDIVNDMAKIKPAPNLRVGLYSYGNDNYDRNNGWIRKDLDLTTDLDELYKRLFALSTRGGTEYVTRVCRDAVNEQKWSEDPKALKIIFVCGNEPASQDPVVKLKEAAEIAKKKGIIINPIFCGTGQPPRSGRLERIRRPVRRPLRQHQSGEGHRRHRHADGQGTGRVRREAE